MSIIRDLDRKVDRERLHFFLLRLKRSSFPELLYRLRQHILVRSLRKRLSLKKEIVSVPSIDPENIKTLQLPTLDGHVDERQVNEILKGKVHSLNIDPVAIRGFTKKYSTYFFADIAPKEQDPDIRAVWEPARLQHLMVLCAYLYKNPETEKGPSIKLFAQQALLAWISANPFLYGAHYISVMECGLRIPVFIYCLKCLDNLDNREEQLILEAIYRHGWWISKRLSLYSSLGNHTIAEAVGLIFAAAVFENTNEGRAWLQTGCELLEGEFDHQILEDGGPAEQSLSYHRFVLDLYWLAIAFLEKNDLNSTAGFKPRLIRAESFLRAFEDSNGRLPSIGDCDDGYALAPYIHPRRPTSKIDIDRKTTFSTSGYTVIRDDQTVLTFNHGRLGMPPLYNHGHADALSITLSVEDRPILVDPGTYEYNKVPEFRRYFKGTRAHNTVSIDGLDQACQETGFIWSRPYTSKLTRDTAIDGGYAIQACHNGYARRKSPVWHSRTIAFFDEAVILIKDTFTGGEIHQFSLHYHLAPETECKRQSDWWLLDNKGARVCICLFEEGSFSLVRGQENPLLGWYAPSYGVLKKSGVLWCEKNGVAGKTSFITVISQQHPVDETELQERKLQLEKQT